jgi:hypothetical protein
MLHSRLRIMADNDDKTIQVRRTVSYPFLLFSSYAVGAEAPSNAAPDIRYARLHCHTAATRYACTPFCMFNLV